MSPANATNQAYWAEYDGLQLAKHQILSRYLGGWFPILASWNGQVVYLDCHAGRGRHATGHEGSPILALQTLLEHRDRARILAAAEVFFVFFEIDQTNYTYLCSEVEALGGLPKRVSVNAYHGDYEAELRGVIGDLRHRGQVLAPAFAFVDPYGFTLPMDLLNELLEFPRCELLINFMYRYVDMAMHNHSPAQADNLNRLFGSARWRQLMVIQDPEARANETIGLFSSGLRAEFVTHMYMRAKNGALKYVLLHATNHRKGRELMKDAMWHVTPDGSFTTSERRDPSQLVLIEPEPNLARLRDRLWECFAGHQVPVSEIYDWLLGELYRKPHLHQVLREYRTEGIVQFSGYDGRFSFTQNPVAHFPKERPSGS